MTPGDTIAAIGSAVGPAARMVVRVSGPAALSIASALTGRPFDRTASNRAGVHTLRFAGLNDVPAWVYAFVAPRSYTGEDAVELHVPGNPLLARLLLDDVVRRGARPAEPGEFTARAYFNGRLDLTEAEGVAATIAAHGEQELSAARRLLAGELARRVRPVLDAVAETLALVEVGIDFADEDVTVLPPAAAAARVGSAAAALRALLGESSRFEQLAHEPAFVLVGRPNAGKSTLLNALAGRARAVTSPVAGTTRDALTAEAALPRGIVRVTDVAGVDDVRPFRDTPTGGTLAPPDAATADIEDQMRQQTLRAVASADFVIGVVDATHPGEADPLPIDRAPDLVVRTKADLLDGRPAAPASTVADASAAVYGRGDGPVLVSAVTGAGLDDLRRAMDALAFGAPAGRATLALNARHRRAIDDALAALARAAAAVGPNAPAEVLALELRDALDALGGIVGAVSPDDVLGRVFSAFCIGK